MWRKADLPQSYVSSHYTVAMMSKTFDNIWDASEINHQFLFARIVQAQHACAPEPPPLNVLKLPAHLLVFSIKHIAARLPDNSRAFGALSSLLAFLVSGMDKSSLVPANSARAINLGPDGEYLGTTIKYSTDAGATSEGARNTLQAWRSSNTVGELVGLVANFVTRHEDDVAIEEHWRAKMTKRIISRLDASDKWVEERLVEQQQAIQDIREMLIASGGGKSLTPSRQRYHGSIEANPPPSWRGPGGHMSEFEA